MSAGAAPRRDGDHHVHPTFSDDAASTPLENLDAARRAGYVALAGVAAAVVAALLLLVVAVAR